MIPQNKIVAIDVETTGLNPWKDQLLGVSIAWTNEAGEIDSEYYEYPKPGFTGAFPYDILADESITKVGHNVRFDIKFLELNNAPVKGPWECTKLMAQLLDENRPLGLKPLAKQFIGADSTFHEQNLKARLKELKLKMSDLGDPRIEPGLIAQYCNEDTENTLKLYRLFHAELKRYVQGEHNLYTYYTQEMLPLEKVLLDMELRGNRLDMEKLTKARETLVFHVERCQKSLDELTAPEQEVVRQGQWEKEKAKFKTQKKKDSIEKPAFNWNSSAQKVELFYGNLGLGQYCKALTPAGSPSLQKSVIKDLEIPSGKLKDTLSLMFDLQTYNKMLSTYVDGIGDRVVNGRIHGEYYQASKEEWKRQDVNDGGTVTGRLSHRNPNLGNLPRANVSDPEDPAYWKGSFVKDLFIPDEGQIFIYADYSQVELRVAAVLSQETKLLKAFREGVDPHQQTADALGITRQEGKTINFLLIYYGSPWRLAIQLGWDVDNEAQMRKAEQVRNQFFRTYDRLHRWILDTRNHIHNYGQISSYYGRIRRLPEVRTGRSRKDREHALKQGSNFVVQTTAVSVCKRAMIQLYEKGFTLCNQVHDSVICQVPIDQAEEKLEEMCNIMRNAAPELEVPLEVDGKIIHTFKE